MLAFGVQHQNALTFCPKRFSCVSGSRGLSLSLSSINTLSRDNCSSGTLSKLHCSANRLNRDGDTSGLDPGLELWLTRLGLESFSLKSGHLTHQQIDLAHRQTRQKAGQAAPHSNFVIAWRCSCNTQYMYVCMHTWHSPPCYKLYLLLHIIMCACAVLTVRSTLR